MPSHARTRAHLRARGGNEPVSIEKRGIQAFFAPEKLTVRRMVTLLYWY